MSEGSCILCDVREGKERGRPTRTPSSLLMTATKECEECGQTVCLECYKLGETTCNDPECSPKLAYSCHRCDTTTRYICGGCGVPTCAGCEECVHIQCRTIAVAATPVMTARPNGECYICKTAVGQGCSHECPECERSWCGNCPPCGRGKNMQQGGQRTPQENGYNNSQTCDRTH